MTTDPFAFARESLRSLAEDDLLRSLAPVSSGPGPEVMIGGRRLINFSSNNYLGLAEHPAVAEAAAEAARRWGAGATASRLIVGDNDLIEALEARLAALRGTEAALVFPSGFQMNLGVVSALAGPGDLVVLDKLCHASLIDAARLSRATLRTFPHRDLNRLDHLLSKRNHRTIAPSHHRTLVVSDGVFSMDGDLADLPALIEITARHGAMLLLDDAHALGIFGPAGAGSLEHFGLSPPPHLIQTATLSKALGSQGGVVCAPRAVVDLLVNRARAFIYSTGLAPPAVAAALAALEIAVNDSERRRRLWANRERLAEGMQEQGWGLRGSASPILPLVTGSAKAALELAAHLREHGLLGVAVRPPTVPRGSARVRLTVMATHTEEHITRLLEAASCFPGRPGPPVHREVEASRGRSARGLSLR
jgi:8-amino-7-oxononanoate synthase